MMITIYILLRYNKIESFWMGYDHIFNKKKCNLNKFSQDIMSLMII